MVPMLSVLSVPVLYGGIFRALGIACNGRALSGCLDGRGIAPRSPFRQCTPDHVEGVLRRAVADLLAVADEGRAAGDDLSRRTGHRRPDRADRLAGRLAIGPGNAGDPHADLGAR